MRHALAVVAIAACSSSSTPPGHSAPGKGDGAFDLVEAGPAPSAAASTSRSTTACPAYRVESYGGTKLRSISSGDGATRTLVVEGPLADDGDAIAVGARHGRRRGRRQRRRPRRAPRLTLDQPGVYRVLAGTLREPRRRRRGEGTLTLSVACSANCYRGRIDQKTFVRALQAQGGRASPTTRTARSRARPRSGARGADVATQLDAILADPNLTGLDRFPTIPLAQIATRAARARRDPGEHAEARRGRHRRPRCSCSAPCTPDRSLPAELDARLPGVRYGQFPSKTLSPCQFAHAGKLAAGADLARREQRLVGHVQGQDDHSPRELFAALVASGHTIEVRNERMYANFLSLIVGDNATSIWPVWLDTGIELSSGESFTIPIGHSHHAWRISGPIVNTRVMFFLGISGAGFFGQTDQRPAWSGTIASTDVTIAARERRLRLPARDRRRGGRVPAPQPRRAHDGRRRACRPTATATSACATTRTRRSSTRRAARSSAFPLLRAKELDAQPDLGDGLDATIRALPKDGDGLPDPHDALRRAVAMQPFPDGSPLMWDATLGAQIATARRDRRTVTSVV